MPPPSHLTAYERHAPDRRIVRNALAPTRQSVFWIDDLGQQEATEALTKPIAADLAVVGGGYLGLWTALQAKRRNPGQKIILLEAQRVGWAASGRNGGFCEATITHGEENGRSRWPDEYDTLDRLGDENLNEFEKDIVDLRIECDWERTGSLQVAVEPHQIPWLGKNHLDGSAVRDHINSPLFLAGSRHLNDSALVHPARLASELARVARALGVEIYEHTAVTGLTSSAATGGVQLETARAVASADRVVLATNVFPSLLRRNRLMTVPVYDYVLMTEPLNNEQMQSIGWSGREGLADVANQFHYSRLTADNRILFGGYDAIYHAGRKVRARYEDRPQTYEKLASHFFAIFPQLEGLAFSHRWAGAIDTCTQFTAYYGLARQGQVAYAAGFTGLGVGATRFAANVLLDKLSGERTERTELKMVRKRPLAFPPEPIAALGINLTRWSLDRADHQEGRRNLFLRTLDAVGLGFDS